ncbi:glycoside hydrolase family 15 protein [Spiribacter vilamensis]|uniref:GH15 family glucan-1,4-alpha-glucosidase n=1 Tax=Spiribacter vilamensis TaxID=531306 RepID=A0A4Q8D2Q7_9GAMM|nr:glycoside hydrolase family 15 protein [Spiribacter vilamensis]RZU99679.1 GH15 family glucan-1,4-alpha-glucosidase [Spiribacter vilamensis]TVO61370.1 glycoside hydrolase family 15 protein [Spiribacter vilamensis]
MAESPGTAAPAAPLNLELGLIGNGQIAGLIDPLGRLVWSCLPRFDAEPAFARLIDDADRGHFSIELRDQCAATQFYHHNTAVLCTELTDRYGAVLRIIDFCPRFRQYGRTYRPVMMLRRLEAVRGHPVIRTRLRPLSGWDGSAPARTRGSNHVRFIRTEQVLRVTTDAPLTHVLDETPFVVDATMTFVLGPDESVQESVEAMGRRFLECTEGYWRDWTRSLAIPFEWQRAVIRAAITLKLSAYEDTGAVIAAITTSIPEAANSGRNWDYRYCWLRDAYFTVHALNRLGATRTMEGFLRYIINLVAGSGDHRLQPLYGIGGERRIEETSADALGGYRGMGPVRVGNAAYHQVQHDVYGTVILAATQAFFDERLERPGDQSLYQRLCALGEEAVRHYDQPDAGIWEYRGRARVHTYSAMMCWAACDRLRRIAGRLGLDADAAYWAEHAATIHATICREAWSETHTAFVESFGGDSLDASLLLMHELGFLAADDPRFIGTVEAIEQQLRRGDHLFRYAAADDFGRPENAFNICTFWFIDALQAIGRGDEARRLFENMLSHRTRLGLLSEDLDPERGELWGNFPQTYSMVGLINSAMHLSHSWEESL